MISRTIFSENIKAPYRRVATLIVKKYKMEAIIRYADYYIENLNELYLDLIEEEFFEKFKEDINWSDVTKLKTLNDDFIIKFKDRINFEFLTEFYPCSVNVINEMISTNIYFNPFLLIKNCNVDFEGLKLLSPLILKMIENVKNDLIEVNINILENKDLEEQWRDFPGSIVLKYVRGQIEKKDLMDRIWEGMQGEFSSALVRKRPRSNYKVLWEPESDSIGL